MNSGDGISRRAMLMSLGAGLMEDGFQSANEACTTVVEDRTNDQSLPPTVTASQPASQPASRVTQGSSSEPTAREQRRRAYYYRILEPNNRNRAQPNNARNTRGVQRVAHEQHTQFNRLSGNRRSDLQGHTVHAQSSSSSNRPPVPPGGALYTGAIAQINNVHHHYHVAPEQLKNPRSIPVAIALPIVAHGAHEQGVGSQGRPQPQTQAQQQALGTASVVAQQQSLSFSPRPSASSGHRHFPHVGIAIAPPSSVNAEPRPITRTRTMPARNTLEFSRSC